jgi:hypothetical protein
MNLILSAAICFVPLANSAIAQAEADYFVKLSPEAYLEYIKAENSAIRSQLTELQNTVQEERKSHYEFVERVYSWTAIGVGVLAFIFGSLISFLGWRTNQQLRKDLYKIMEASIKEPLILKKLIDMVNNQLGLENGRFCFLADESLHEGLQAEVKSLTSSGIKVKLQKPGHSLRNVDVLIYRFNPDEKKEDENLKTLIDKLIKQKASIPIVVYVPDKLRIEGETHTKLNSYKMQHIANNMISLVDNVSSAYRVNKLMTQA